MLLSKATYKLGIMLHARSKFSHLTLNKQKESIHWYYNISLFLFIPTYSNNENSDIYLKM